MMDSLRQRAWRRVRFLFPERQIYVRSDGRVQFFTFSSQMQAIFAGIAILFLGWVAFTSVNVIFKDRILAAKEHHFDEMQSFYEGRIADLQLSYDELNSQLVVAQDRFRTVADAVEAKQQVLAALIEGKKELRASLTQPVGKQASTAKPSKAPALQNGNGVGGVFDAVPESASALAPPFAAGSGIARSLPEPTNQEAVRPQSPAVRVIPTKPPFFKGAVEKLGALFRHKLSVNDSNPTIKEADQQSARLVRLEVAQPALLAEATQDLNQEAARLMRALKTTNIDTKKLMSRTSQAEAVGGPLIPIDSAELGDDAFSAGIAEATGALQKLHDLVAALRALPLITPTDTGGMSSGFGARLDPFNEQLAFHSGVDFSAPKGADVHSTAAGIVVFAGPRGAYGNTVEIDHGFGIRTRYGHLSKILAQVGSEVDTNTLIGRIGSTGRSTGPHVHYEIWFDQSVKDPSSFIRAGHNVFQE